MPRCWRLAYANEFHLDITPSIPNPWCDQGGELVPDKTLQEWKGSNPKGYRSLFEQRARLLRPRMGGAKSLAADGVSARTSSVIPPPMRSKGVLRRTVQLAKRHRVVYFADLDPCLAPISIIVTTLAARSYEHCVTTFEDYTEFDLLCDIIRYMPQFLETQIIAGRRQWFLWNETTREENFAEKWNAEPSRAEAFYAWQARSLGDFKKLVDLTGIDRLQKDLSGAFGFPQSPTRSTL